MPTLYPTPSTVLAVRALGDRLGVDLSGSSAVASALARLERPRGHVVQWEGEAADWAYLVLEGAARSYTLDDGEAHVAWFAFEGDVLASPESLTGSPAPETIELVEPSLLVSIDVRALRPLVGRDAAVTALALALVSEHARALAEEIRALRSLSAAERYALLQDRAPDVLRRVRLQDVASYLGVARETLSRIRAGGRL